MRKRNFNILIFLFVVILLFGLGYAYLTTTLSINGTTDVDSNTWNVYWDNVQVTEGSVTANTPVIDTNKTTVSFSVHLSKPGDFYEFTVDAKNDGTIDAMIDTITKTTDIPSYINYTVIYSDEISINQYDLLSSTSKNTYKIRVEYKTDINANQLPNTSQSLSLSFGVAYIQATEQAKLVSKEIYTFSDLYFHIGEEIPNGAITYNTYEEAIANYGYPFFLKHVIANGIVIESYAGFVKDNQAYYLKGGGATWNEDDAEYNYDSIYYDENVAVLQSAFTASQCGSNEVTYGCSINGVVAGSARRNGSVDTSSGYYGRCYVYADGSSNCI